MSLEIALKRDYFPTQGKSFLNPNSMRTLHESIEVAHMPHSNNITVNSCIAHKLAIAKKFQEMETIRHANLYNFFFVSSMECIEAGQFVKIHN